MPRERDFGHEKVRFNGTKKTMGTRIPMLLSQTAHHAGGHRGCRRVAGATSSGTASYRGGQNDCQPFFFFKQKKFPEFRQKITWTLQKTPNSGKMATVISRSEIILAFFFFARTVRSTDDG